MKSLEEILRSPRRLSPTPGDFASLGELRFLASLLSEALGDAGKKLSKGLVFICADHGASEGLSAKVLPHLSLQSPAAAAAQADGAKVHVFDCGLKDELPGEEARAALVVDKVGSGTRPFVDGPAMSREEAVRSVEAGVRFALEHLAGTDVVGLNCVGGEMSAFALASLFTGKPLASFFRRRTRSEKKLYDKVFRALREREFDLEDPMKVLAELGGFDIGACAGVIVGCASMAHVAVADGPGALAGAFLAWEICPDARGYVVASAARSCEALAKELDVPSLYAFSVEGVGAALGCATVEAVYGLALRLKGTDAGA